MFSIFDFFPFIYFSSRNRWTKRTKEHELRLNEDEPMNKKEKEQELRFNEDE